MKALSDRLTGDRWRPSFECEAIRSVSSRAGRPSPMRNTCEFHIGHDREGNICGFRLGLAAAAALAIGPPDRVPFVPGWMSAIATAVGEELELSRNPQPLHRICYHMRRYSWWGMRQQQVPQY